MEKRIYILLTLVLLVSFIRVPQAFAENTETEDGIIMSETETTTTTDTTSRKTPAEIKAQREVRMEEVKQKREDMKAEIEAKREEAKAAMETKREEFQAKLASIKDEKKAMIVERVDARLAERNQRIADRLLGHLERISAIIDKMEDKLSDAAGGDATEVNAAIASARAAVTTAEAAVVTQSGNAYVIELGDDGELKTVVEATVSQFRADMEVAIASVKAARDATQEAARALAAFRDGQPPKEDAMMEEKMEPESN